SSAGVAAPAVRPRGTSSAGGETPGANRDGIPRSLIVVPPPSGGSQRRAELLVCPMGTLSHDRLGRSEHRSRCSHGETFLLEKDIRDAVLLRHPGELSRHDVREIAGANARLRRMTIVGQEATGLRRILARTQ